MTAVSENKSQQKRKPGPKKPHRGNWKPGQSGNPGGRPKQAPEVRALALKHCPEAILTAVDIMRKSDNDRTRLAAAEFIAERGLGKAPQPHTGEDGNGPIEVTWADVVGRLLTVGHA